MGNVTNINNNLFRFELYNLNYFNDCDTEISGHYTFWWHKPTGKYVFCKHGDYHNLVSFKPIHESPRLPSVKEHEFLNDLVNETIHHAYFYTYGAPHGCGRFLNDELERKCDKRENGYGTEWFKLENGLYDHVFKINGIFNLDYPDADYKADEPYWNNVKSMDNTALNLFGEKHLTK